MICEICTATVHPETESLCRRCQQMLIAFRYDPNIIHNAIAYIKRHEPKRRRGRPRKMREIKP